MTLVGSGIRRNIVNRTTAESPVTATPPSHSDGSIRAKVFGTDKTKVYPVKQETVAVMSDESR
jgi:hypothetical protein